MGNKGAKQARGGSVMDSAKRFRVNFIILSLGYILLGLFRIFNQDQQSMLICYLLGGVAIVGGIARIAMYFFKEMGTRIFRNDLAIGVSLLIAGIYCILKPETILTLLPVVLGFCVIFDSVLKLEYSFDMRRAVFGGWVVVMVLGVVSAICGVLLVLGSFEGTVLFYFLGATLLYDGVLNLLTLSMLMLVLRHREKHPLDGAAAGKAKAEPAKTLPPTTEKPAKTKLFAKGDKAEAPEAGEGASAAMAVTEKATPEATGTAMASDTEVTEPTKGPASPTMEEEAEKNGSAN